MIREARGQNPKSEIGSPERKEEYYHSDHHIDHIGLYAPGLKLAEEESEKLSNTGQRIHDAIDDIGIERGTNA
jgi:hypothetical protein